MPRFFLSKQQINDNRGLITGQELTHLRKVLRLVPGDRITVFDDFGWEHEAVIRSLSAEQGEIEILSSYETDRESPLKMILAVALTTPFSTWQALGSTERRFSSTQPAARRLDSLACSWSSKPRPT